MLQGWLPYIVIAVVAIVLAVVTVIVARTAWRHQVRSLIVNLIGRRSSIVAALQTAEGALRALSQGSVPQLLEFAGAGSEERRAFAELAERMRMEAAELGDVALPKRLWPLADELTSAARSLAEQAGRVGDSQGEPVLDALLALDLTATRESLARADEHVAAMSAAYKVTDSAVYGGGLYI